MSNEKKVWVSFIDTIGVLKSYRLRAGFPKSDDYPEYYKLEQEIAKAKKTNDTEKKAEIEAKMSDFLDRSQNIILNYRRHESIELPDKLWLLQKPLPSKNGYFFWIVNGFLILNQACAEILQQFNLGNTTLTPLKIHHPKTQQPINDEIFYLINVAEQREFLVKEQTNEHLEYKEYDTTWRYTARLLDKMKNYTVDIDATATQCDLDLWHDPHLSQECYFMSNALYQALADARLHKKWNIQPCTLVGKE